LAYLSPKGFIAPSAQIYHTDFQQGKNVFIGERVIIYQAAEGGLIQLGDRVCFLRDSILETGSGGSLTFGDDAYIHPRCQFNAHKASIHIGSGVMIAANCAFYPHDHGMELDIPIRDQPLQTRGDIVIGDNAWLATGVIVLGGVRIGEGSVIGAGAVVTNSIPDNAIAIGVPARVVKMRSDLTLEEDDSSSS
jgi:acetyltransferase-like isoleucine patch superfamily enzyme